MAQSCHWPPDEEVTPLTVVARLDDLGWTPGSYRLETNSTNHVLVTYARAVVLLDLRDGHEVSRYGDLEAGQRAFAPYLRRDAEDGES